VLGNVACVAADKCAAGLGTVIVAVDVVVVVGLLVAVLTVASMANSIGRLD
jgi:hypothetical protein